MTTTYEWAIETVTADDSEDILDVDHRDRLHEWPAERLLHALNQDREPAGAFMKNDPGTFTRLALVRDSDRDGRAWAYIGDDGALPAKMLDAYDRPVCDVPKRYREEFMR